MSVIIADVSPVFPALFPEMFCDWEQVTKDQVLNLLLLLRDFFIDRGVWITWPLAENQKGYEVDPASPEAVRWCLSGASEKITKALYQAPLSGFIDCATKDFLNELSDESLIKGSLSYEDEFALICLAINELEKKDV